jgi:hypothetical protein
MMFYLLVGRQPDVIDGTFEGRDALVVAFLLGMVEGI